ncbi:hypothetical protein HHI36_018818 [Cryptolaemus montrouzieri]|uniref:APAF-1 helical domain-containing protein n=1 Tax=Cryptolaemus montrouzieri TaxID=559131 RepID=A0ABD2P1S8_9CUCU
MLPDDNYILLFLGYHLKQADLIDKFEAFLDLKFMEHKIKLVGVSNLEHDFKTYGNEIINDDPERRSKLEKCLEFIKENKNELRQLQKTDIVQLALPTLKDDAQMLMVQNEANSINRLYFTIKFSAGRLKSSQEIFMDKEVTSMAFCTDSNVSKILIGLKNGDIVLYCSQNHKEFDRFQGHKQPVFDLKIAHDNTCFLSVSQDHTVKLWNFFSQRSSIDGIDLPTSPKCVQSEYYHVFNSGKRNNFKEFIYNEDNDYLVSANFANNYSVIKKICTGTNNGKVILWNAYTREKLFITTETGFPVENIYFSHDDSGVLFTKQEKIQIYKYENEELAYSGSISNMEDIVKFFMSNENTVISVGLRHVMMYKQPYESNPIKVYDSPDYNITCSAVAKGEYFAIGVRETVFLFSIASGQLVETLKHNKIVTSISMDIAKDDDNITSMILMNFDDNNIQQCNLMMQHYTQPRNKHGLVTTYWKNKNTPLLAFVSNDNILKIQHEFNTINEIEKPHKISFITFSLCGNNIIFSSENGEIVEYQYKRQGCFKILMELRSTVKYLKCFESGLPIEGDKKIHVLLSDGHLNKFSWDIPIFHVFPIASRKLLCIDESGGIFIITLKDEKIVQLVIYATCYRKVTSAAYCLKNNLVAITFIKQNFKTNYLEITDITTKEILQNLFLDFVPECCAFSHQGDLLVLGGEDGKIMICNIRDNFRKIFLSNAGSPIKFLQFSQSELPILVTVGKEISWWNLSNFQFDSKEISTLYNNDFDLVFWKNKTFHKEIDYLLQTVTLYSNAVHFSVSKNFETFLVVDDESRIYVLKCFKNVQ